VHENVLPAVVNTGAAIAEACQSGISVQSCHVCHFIPTWLCAWAPAVCDLQSGVCSSRLPYLLQLVEPLCSVALRAVRSTIEWSLTWRQYLWAYGDMVISMQMVKRVP